MSFYDPNPGSSKDRNMEERMNALWNAANTVLKQNNELRDILGVGTSEGREFSEQVITTGRTIIRSIRTSGSSAHAGSTSNPHEVSAEQVGNDVAQWNADKIQGYEVPSTITSGYLHFDGEAFNTLSVASGSVVAGPYELDGELILDGGFVII